MEEVRFGLRIKILPDKMTVGAISNEGLLALKNWISIDRNPSLLRSKLGISEIEYPIFTFKHLKDGKIFMVEFTKED